MTVPAGDWIEITGGDATEITFQNVGRNYVLLQGTAGSVKPSGEAGKAGALRDNRFTGIL